jgi:hypothetical protein
MGAMRIRVTKNSLSIGSKEVAFDSYYLYLNEAYKHLSGSSICKKMLEQWAAALGDLADESCELYLPYNLGDEWIDSFRATRSGNSITFEQVWVRDSGWRLDVSNLKDFIHSAQRIRRNLGVFGVFDRDELIRSLLDAEVDETPNGVR